MAEQKNTDVFSPYRTHAATAKWYALHPLTIAVLGIAMVVAVAASAFLFGPSIAKATTDWLNPEPEIIVEPGETILVDATDLIAAREDLETYLETADAVLENTAEGTEKIALASAIADARDLLDDPSSTLQEVSDAATTLHDATEAAQEKPKPTPTPTPTNAPAPDQEPDPAPEPEPEPEPYVPSDPDPEPYNPPAPDPEPYNPPAPDPEPAGAPWSVSCSGNAVATVYVDGASWQTTGGSGTFYSSFSFSWSTPDGSGSCS